jgi:hypothetical protein
MLTLLQATVARVAPVGSPHRRHADEVCEKYGRDNGYIVSILAGVLQALRADYVAGRLQSVSELIHADLFSDFLEMAAYLHSEGYKDAAAVISGSVLEGHLRKLCEKLQIVVSAPNGRPKKADALNADLTAKGAYPKLDQKSVTAWLGLRNYAAHGEYDRYTSDQVALLLEGVRGFLGRHPA